MLGRNALEYTVKLSGYISAVMKTPTIWLLSGVLALIVAVSPAQAAEDYRDITRNAANNYVTQGSKISPKRAANIARRHVDGRVLKVKPARDGGYQVRVLAEGGRVVTVVVDDHGRVRDR